LKKCSKCKKKKDISDFYKTKTNPDGHSSHCKKCYEKYYGANTDKKKNYFLKREYGITLEEKREMYENQLGLCKLCNLLMVKPKDCHVEHNHATGEIRGLVHSKCNLLLGIVQDNIGMLIRAIHYLEETSFPR
jgi:Recombination endonuclease VII